MSHFSNEYCGIFAGLGAAKDDKKTGKRSSEVAPLYKTAQWDTGCRNWDTAFRESEFNRQYKPPVYEPIEHVKKWKNFSQVEFRQNSAEDPEKYLSEAKRHFRGAGGALSGSAGSRAEIQKLQTETQVVFSEEPANSMRHLQTHSSFVHRNPSQMDKPTDVTFGPDFWDKRPPYNTTNNGIKICEEEKPKSFGRVSHDFSTLPLRGTRNPILHQWN